MKALILGLGVAQAARGVRRVEGTASITQPSCFRVDTCTFGPESIAYVPSNPVYSSPKQCASAAAVSTTAMSSLNRGEFTLSTAHKVPLLFASVPYDVISADDSPFPPSQFNVQRALDDLAAKDAVAPGLLTIDGAYFVCKDSSETHLAAPLQCKASTCVSFRDTWPPKARATCPSYLSVAIVNFDATTFYTHLRDPFEEAKWASVVDEFVQWGANVDNFPCVAGDVAKSRCDTFTVQAKRIGQSSELDFVRGSDADKVEVLRELDTPTAAEMNELKAIAQSMDLSVDKPATDPATVCTKCVHASRVLKEWVHPATCTHPLDTTPRCQGTDTCSLNHCVTFAPKDLFAASLAATPHALEMTEQTKTSSTLAHYLKDEVVYNSASDTIRLVAKAESDLVNLAVESLVQVVVDDGGRDMVKTQVTWTVQRPNGRAVFQRWTPLQDSRVDIPTSVGQKAPTIVAFAVRSWTPCGKIASKNYLLRVFRQDAPNQSVYVGAQKYVDSLYVQDDGAVLARVQFGVVALCVVGGVLLTRRRRGPDDVAYQLVLDRTML